MTGEVYRSGDGAQDDVGLGNGPCPNFRLTRGEAKGQAGAAHNESLMLSSCRRVDRTGVGHTGWMGRLLLGHTVRQEWWWVGSTGHYEDSTGVRQPVDGVRPHPELRQSGV